MKTLLFDLYHAQPSGGSKYHGGGEYIKSIFKALVEEYLDRIQLVVFFNNSLFLDEWIKDTIDKKNIQTYFVTELSQLQHVFEKMSVDIFFSGLPEHFKPEWFPQNVIKVGTIHGLRKIEKASDRYEYKYVDNVDQKIKASLRFIRDNIHEKRVKERFIQEQKRVTDFLDIIITDSNHSLYAFDFYYSNVLQKIRMYYPPAKIAIKAQETIFVEKKYILLIGANRWMKNVYRGLKAIDSLYSKSYLSDIKTVVVGNVSKTIKKEFAGTKNFVWMDYVDAEVLESLYKHCVLFLYPSLNEGFGYPPLEAMKYGKTCVVSAVCSLPEICGDAVYYVNPYDISEIANRVLQGIEKPIDTELIMKHFLKVENEQNKSMKKICELFTSNDIDKTNF